MQNNCANIMAETKKNNLINQIKASLVDHPEGAEYSQLDVRLIFNVHSQFLQNDILC